MLRSKKWKNDRRPREKKKFCTPHTISQSSPFFSLRTRQLRCACAGNKNIDSQVPARTPGQLTNYSTWPHAGYIGWALYSVLCIIPLRNGRMSIHIEGKKKIVGIKWAVTIAKATERCRWLMRYSRKSVSSIHVYKHRLWHSVLYIMRYHNKSESKKEIGGWIIAKEIFAIILILGLLRTNSWDRLYFLKIWINSRKFIKNLDPSSRSQLMSRNKARFEFVRMDVGNLSKKSTNATPRKLENWCFLLRFLYRRFL